MMGYFPADETTMTMRSIKAVDMFLEVMESIRTEDLHMAYLRSYRLGEYILNANGSLRAQHIVFMIAREMMRQDTKTLPVVSERTGRAK